MQDNQLVSSEVFLALERAIYRGVRNAVEDILATGDLQGGGSSPDTDQSLRLIPSKEACSFLGISERTLFDLSKSGEIPKVHVGKSVRYCQKDLDAYVNGLRDEA